MKIIMVIMLSLVLAGCGNFDRVTTSVTGRPTEVCVDGVTYLQFTSGATVKFGTNSEIVPCK